MTEQDVRRVFTTGAVRSADAEDTRFDLITPIGLRRLAETCAEGAEHMETGIGNRDFPPPTWSTMPSGTSISGWPEMTAKTIWPTPPGTCWPSATLKKSMPEMIDIPARTS